jgi:hypothetical protein
MVFSNVGKPPPRSCTALVRVGVAWASSQFWRCNEQHLATQQPNIRSRPTDRILILTVPFQQNNRSTAYCTCRSTITSDRPASVHHSKVPISRRWPFRLCEELRMCTWNSMINPLRTLYSEATFLRLALVTSKCNWSC